MRDSKAQKSVAMRAREVNVAVAKVGAHSRWARKELVVGYLMIGKWLPQQSLLLTARLLQQPLNTILSRTNGKQGCMEAAISIIR